MLPFMLHIVMCILIAQCTPFQLCDFGVSKPFDFTRPGTLVGTYRWMAPEVGVLNPNGIVYAIWY